jgi:pimeloyl-ACP methyl ester carboxylesterase
MHRILLVSLAALTAAAVSLYAILVRDLAAARARLVARSETIETSSGTLEYAVIGAGDPMLIVHGAGGGFDQGVDMAGELATRGYRLIIPSRFGYLRSAQPADATVAMQADAYVQLLDRLGVDKVVAVAISAGAWSSLQFAIRHPQRCRALVLMVPADYLPPGKPVHGGRLVEAFLQSDFVAWAALQVMRWPGSGRMMEAILGTDPAVVSAATPSERARAQRVLDHLLPMSPRVGGMQFDIETAAARGTYDLAKIACPVLTISARDDRFGTSMRAEYIAANVSDGRAVVFPTGGHALIGRYAEVLRETESFVHTLHEQRGASN